MMIFEKAQDNAAAIKQIGLHALEAGQRIGAPIHYMDKALGDGLIRHFPDGRRQRLGRVEGRLVVLESLDPVAAIVPK